TFVSTQNLVSPVQWHPLSQLPTPLLESSFHVSADINIKSAPVLDTLRNVFRDWSVHKILPTYVTTNVSFKKWLKTFLPPALLTTADLPELRVYLVFLF